MRAAHRTLLMCAVLVLAAIVWAPTSALAFESPNDPSSSELVEEPNRFDGTTVEFTGEAIGEAMVRGENAWIHLNDDAYMYKNVEEGAQLGGYNTGMPVWIPAVEAGEIEVFGDYKHEGDVVTIKGVFNAACAMHGGDMDIHATELEVQIPGRPAGDPVKPWKLALALGLTAATAGAWYGDHRLRRRERTGVRIRRL